jgi:hypothetical protein
MPKKNEGLVTNKNMDQEIINLVTPPASPGPAVDLITPPASPGPAPEPAPVIPAPIAAQPPAGIIVGAAPVAAGRGGRGFAGRGGRGGRAGQAGRGGQAGRAGQAGRGGHAGRGGRGGLGGVGVAENMFDLIQFRNHFNACVNGTAHGACFTVTTPYVRQLVTHLNYRNFISWEGTRYEDDFVDSTWRGFVNDVIRATFTPIRANAIANFAAQIPNIGANQAIPTVVLPAGGQFEDVITAEEIRNNDVVLISVSAPIPPHQAGPFAQIPPAHITFEFGSMIKLNAEETPVPDIVTIIQQAYVNQNHDTILHQLPIALVIARVQYPPGAAFGSRRVVHFGRFVDRYRKKHHCSADYALAKYMKAMSLL